MPPKKQAAVGDDQCKTPSRSLPGIKRDCFEIQQNLAQRTENHSSKPTIYGQ